MPDLVEGNIREDRKQNEITNWAMLCQDQSKLYQVAELKIGQFK